MITINEYREKEARLNSLPFLFENYLAKMPIVNKKEEI